MFTSEDVLGDHSEKNIKNEGRETVFFFGDKLQFEDNLIEQYVL